MNLYDHLELSPDADADTIRQAIMRQSAVWSKRVAASASLQRKHEAENMLQVLADAKHHLLDPERRQAYDALLVGLPSPQAVQAGGLPGDRPGSGPIKTGGANTGPRPAAPPPEAEKACPFCGEMIKRAAIKCRHCGEFLEEATQTVPPAQPSPPPKSETPAAPPPPPSAPTPAPAPSSSGGLSPC